MSLSKSCLGMSETEFLCFEKSLLFVPSGGFQEEILDTDPVDLFVAIGF